MWIDTSTRTAVHCTWLAAGKSLSSFLSRMATNAAEVQPQELTVYKIFSLGSRRDHAALFVETENNKGHLYHVTASIAYGMTFEHRVENPTESLTFLRKERLGTIESVPLANLEEIFGGLKPPPKQFDDRFKRIDPTKPLLDCRTWTKDALELLIKRGILMTE